MPNPLDHGPMDTTPHDREALEILRESELEEYGDEYYEEEVSERGTYQY